MKKITLLTLTLLFALTIAACRGEEDQDPPVFEGVEDTQILQGESFDPMEGVSAYDYDGNDITEDIEVDGSVNSDILGEHNVTYSVTDDLGQTSTENRYITVVFETDEPHEVYNGDFSLGTGGWSFDQPGGEADWDVVDEILNVSIDSPGNEWWQLQIYQLIEITEDTRYRVEIEARSPEGKSLGIGFEDTTAGYAMIANGAFAVELSEDFETYEFYFDSDRSIDAAKFVLYLGQMGEDEGESHVDVRNVSIDIADNDFGDAVFSGTDDTVIMLGETFDPLEGISAELDGDDVTDSLTVNGLVRTNVANRTPFLVQYILDTDEAFHVVTRLVDVEIGAAADRLFNTDFEMGITGWTVDFPGNEAAGSMNVVENELVVELSDLGTEYWHAQLSQSGRLIEEGKTYELSFRARAEDDKVLGLGIEDGDDDFEPLTDTLPQFTVGEDYETFTYQFTADADYDNIKYALFFGHMSGDDVPTTVYVDHFQVREVVESGASVIENPDMEEDEGWTFDFPEGEGTMEYVDGELVADITDTGDYWWHIQLQQDGINVDEGVSYLVTLRVKSDVERTVGLGLEDADDGFASVIDEELNYVVGEEYDTIYYLFTPGASYDNLKLALFLGNIDDDPASTVTVDTFDMTVADDQNIMENSTFENDDVWDYDFAEGEGTMYTEDNTLIAELSDIGDAWWHVQLAQLDRSIEAGETYLITFRASSTEERRIGLALEDAADGFRDLKGDEPVEWDLDEEMRTYTFLFESEDTIDTAKIGLFFGWHVEGDVESTIEVKDFFAIQLTE